ncbi:YwmB family TATA-box binding protein [Bacillus sp. 1P06AnD]|uniref:YwmB family TATA-box binding protein n=1 Tax=Bacillus sp. 1P06AnD TaxID=3132208 RepID=UPI00399FC9D2
MKKIFLYAALLGLIIGSVGNITTEAMGGKSDLDQIYSILKDKKDAKVEGWSLTARELLVSISDENEFNEQINQMKRTFPDFKWNIMKQSTKLVAVGMKSDSRYTETVTVASAHNRTEESYITYEMQGTVVWPGWEKDVNERVQSRKKVLFKRNTTIFTCIKGSINDTIDEVLTSRINAWMKDFKANEIESLKEHHFISVTAKSSLFKQTYVSKQYNLQLAMRSDGLGASTSFVIGTPIITFEY